MEGDIKRRMFPAEIEPEQVIELAKILSTDINTDVVSLEKYTRTHLDEVERLVNASQILGVTKIHDGRICLSELGTRLNDLPMQEKRHLIGERLTLVEPFRTAIEIATKNATFSSDKVAGELYRNELRWAEEEDLNELIVHDILVDFAVFTGLLEYDGRSDTFRMQR